MNHYDDFLFFSEKNDTLGKTRKRKSFGSNGSMLDPKRVEFEFLQQEKHRQLQEEAIRMTQEDSSLSINLPKRRTIVIPQTPERKVKKSNSQKTLRKSQRRPSLPGEDHKYLCSVEVPLSGSLSKATANNLNRRLSFVEEIEADPISIKSPKSRRKGFKNLIKTLEKNVQSPRNRKKNNGKSASVVLDLPTIDLALSSEEEDEIDDLNDSATFILSPKSGKNSKRTPDIKSKRKGTNRSRSMSFSKNETITFLSSPSSSDGDNILSAPEIQNSSFNTKIDISQSTEDECNVVDEYHSA